MRDARQLDRFLSRQWQRVDHISGYSSQSIRCVLVLTFQQYSSIYDLKHPAAGGTPIPADFFITFRESTLPLHNVSMNRAAGWRSELSKVIQGGTSRCVHSSYDGSS